MQINMTPRTKYFKVKLFEQLPQDVLFLCVGFAYDEVVTFKGPNDRLLSRGYLLNTEAAR